MFFTFIKTEIVCALVYSEGTAVVVVTVILGRHGVMASASYRFSQYSYRSFCFSFQLMDGSYLLLENSLLTL